MMKTKLMTGSAKPKAPVSHRTEGAAGGNHPGKYNPSSAASHLKEQDRCVPANGGPMKMKGN